MANDKSAPRKIGSNALQLMAVRMSAASLSCLIAHRNSPECSKRLFVVKTKKKYTYVQKTQNHPEDGKQSADDVEGFVLVAKLVPDRENNDWQKSQSQHNTSTVNAEAAAPLR